MQIGFARAALAAALALAPACRADGAGVGPGPGSPGGAAADASGQTGDTPAERGPRLDAPDAEAAGLDLAMAATDAALSPEPPPAAAGPAADMGCADGTREAFADPTGWPDLAGCAGGFRVPGLLSDRARRAQCDRQAGNTGGNAAGVGCAVADLCAEGWHVCEEAGEVARRAPAGCAGAIPPGYAAFFVVRAGATADGVCIPGTALSNDLHGCGSIGTPEHGSCAPLDRRLDFVACLGTGGAWSCGDDRRHLQETAEVSKPGPAMGGALCCRDP